MDVLALVTQPDRPVGRDQHLHMPPTKLVALAHGIKVLQPERLSKSEETVAYLNSLSLDLIVMVAFGQILKKSVLSMPRIGVVNLHFSLLPAYRGAAPANWAIMNGDTEGGISTMVTEAGVDTGPILLTQPFKIEPDINSQELARLMADSGATLVMETLKGLVAGTIVPRRQDDSKATYAPMLTKDLGSIDWSRTAADIHNLVRGLIPWPGTFTTFKGNPLKIWKTTLDLPSEMVSEAKPATAKPGSIVIHGKHIAARCGTGGSELIGLLEVQPVNRTRISAVDWANGARPSPEERLGN